MTLKIAELTLAESITELELGESAQISGGRSRTRINYSQNANAETWGSVFQNQDGNMEVNVYHVDSLPTV